MSDAQIYEMQIAFLQLRDRSASSRVATKLAVLARLRYEGIVNIIESAGDLSQSSEYQGDDASQESVDTSEFNFDKAALGAVELDDFPVLVYEEDKSKVARLQTLLEREFSGALTFEFV